MGIGVEQGGTFMGQSVYQAVSSVIRELLDVSFYPVCLLRDICAFHFVLNEHSSTQFRTELLISLSASIPWI